ncbi:MAG: A24 family peptidase [Pirellulaceae bacterium]
MSNWLAYSGLFVLGTLLGSQLNHAIYRWAWNARRISPWSPADPQAPPRRLLDRLPVLGWWGLRREAALHGRSFWIRPMLLEIVAGVALASLYWWEIGRLEEAGLTATLSLRYLSHVILISLLAIATFIDFDEQTIPDLVTVPGTLVGLLLAAVVPVSLLPATGLNGIQSPLLVTSPFEWDSQLDGPVGLLSAWACLLVWCLAILPKVCTLRKGYWQSIRIMLASIVRPQRRTKSRLEVKPRKAYMITRVIGLSAVVGMLMIAVVWSAGELHWRGLLTALLGMAFGGGVIWSVRLIGGYAMQQEAMGFGDVTLMAMIGAFLGWQSTLIVFFLAPFAALLIGLIQLISIRRTDIAFGPYLALASVVLVIAWEPIWDLRAREFFQLGWFIPLLVGCCLILMGLLLVALQWLKQLFRGGET